MVIEKIFRNVCGLFLRVILIEIIFHFFIVRLLVNTCMLVIPIIMIAFKCFALNFLANILLDVTCIFAVVKGS